MRAKTVFLICLGVATALPLATGVATFVNANGAAYLSTNPRACVNCHIMQPQYEAWTASSHATVASCNDCHSHGTLVEKYAQKAVNGFLHSWAFTTGNFHEPIQIKEFNLKITQHSCRRCHGHLAEASRFDHASFADNNCLHCHREVGHRKW